MRKIYLMTLLVAATLLYAPAKVSARESDDYRGGLMLTSWMFTPGDIVNLSQFEGRYGTARSMAMGGAFTALGADLSSAHINPAGLGLYRSSEFGITPSVVISSVDTKAMQGEPIHTRGDSKTRFGINNGGIAFNIYQGSGGLTSATLAFSVNKLADFNYRTSVGFTGAATIGDAYAQQLELSGIHSDDLLGNSVWRYTSPELWGATSAYKTYMLSNYGFDPDDPDAPAQFPKNYMVSGVARDAIIHNNMFIDSRGSTNEIAFSAGFNIKNKFYFGLTLGIVQYYNKQTLHYSEDFENNADAITPLRYMDLSQYRKFDGTGFNFKLGVLYNPVAGLRLGAAFHTPTYSDVKMSYQIWNESHRLDTGERPWVMSEVNSYNHKFNTPSRLLLGASYTFGSSGIISFDYERTWYKGMKYKTGTGFDRDLAKYTFKNSLKDANTIRVGAEVRPAERFFVRGGFAYMFEMNNDKRFDVDLNMLDYDFTYKSYNASLGVGFQLSRHTMLDVTYSYFNHKRTGLSLFNMYLEDDPMLPEEDNPGFEIFSPGFRSTVSRHAVTFSLNFRF